MPTLVELLMLIKADGPNIDACSEILGRLSAKHYELFNLLDNKIFGILDISEYSQAVQDEMLDKTFKAYEEIILEFVPYIQIFQDKFAPPPPEPDPSPDPQP